FIVETGFMAFFLLDEFFSVSIETPQEKEEKKYFENYKKKFVQYKDSIKKKHLVRMYNYPDELKNVERYEL
ncbi:hypothetical protein U2060_15150, partial [Listeria monocytogenes]|uniref:hypothetical protein n=1 Tax=Listeria monocytogenes TaxID=1639 RepID=UPI002FDC6A97